MGSEWSWDLGADGVVRLVVDARGVETIYRAGRIVARSPAGGSRDGHVVTIPPRLPKDEAFREASVPSRELRLRRERWAEGDTWRGALEGVEITPSVSRSTIAPDVEPAASARSGHGRWVGILVGCAVGGLVATFASRPAWHWAKMTIARQEMTRASHQEKLGKQWWSADSNVTVLSPSDFETLSLPQPMAVGIARKGNAEVFGTVMVVNPKTSDLDEILRGAVEGGRSNLPAGVDFIGGIGAFSDGDCNGQPGRISEGKLTDPERTAALKFWICVSLRPDVGKGLRRPSVQLFFFTVPDFLVARDEPTLREMIKRTEMKDVAGAAGVASDPFGPARFDAFSKKR